MSDAKIVLITRKTRLEGLIERFNTRGQARFYLEHSGGASGFDFYEREHETYYAAVSELRRELQAVTRMHEIERGFLPNYLFGEQDVVVTIGIDGLVVNTAKYLHGQPLVAVNPDPTQIDGVLLPFKVAQASAAVRLALQGRAKLRPVTMAEARLNDGQSLLAFNDLFIGVGSHVSARYRIRLGDRQENHSSSGVLVSTGAGSTGWLSSMFNMVNGLAQYEWGAVGSRQSAVVSAPRLEWGSRQLVFVVREPFVSKTSSARLVCGAITPEQPLVLESHIPEGGVIFSDGVEADRLAFNSGATATIGLAQRQTNLVVAAA